jgi:acetyl-CoA synthetase
MGKEIWLGFDHRADDRFFWLSDIGWMMGPWSILGNHLFGGTIFLYDGAPDYPGPMRLWETIERHRITTFGVSPTAIRVLSKSAGELPPMESLRLLGSTGEPWDEASWMWFFERVGAAGAPSSTFPAARRSSAASCFLCPSSRSSPARLGGPAPGMATEVVDENGHPVRGRTGTWSAPPSPSMTRGIWNRPAALHRNLLVAFPRHVVSRRLGQRG